MPKKTKSTKKNKSKKIEISDVDSTLGDTDIDDLETLKQNDDIVLEASSLKNVENTFENFGLKLNNAISLNLNDVMSRFSSIFEKNMLAFSKQISENLSNLSQNVSVINKNISQTASNSGEPRDRNYSDGNSFNRNYVSTWKDLGGSILQFSASSSFHPVYFLKKLETMLIEAGVPDHKKIYFAISCLKGSALDWAELKEFHDFGDFKNQFLSRYWGIEKERN